MAFIVFAVIVYELPRSRILDQIDGELRALATEVVQPGSLPEVLETFETASTLVIVADENGEIVGGDAEAGGRLRAKFLRSLPALKQLVDRVKLKAKKLKELREQRDKIIVGLEMIRQQPERVAGPTQTMPCSSRRRSTPAPGNSSASPSATSRRSSGRSPRWPRDSTRPAC